jgi:hypothetical protein
MILPQRVMAKTNIPTMYVDRLSYIAVNAFTDHLKDVYKHLFYMSTRLSPRPN